MRLDPFTLLSTATVLNLLFIGAFALVALRARGDERPLLGNWALGLGLQCASFAALGSMAWRPSPWTGVIGNVLLLGAYFGFLWAVRGYAGEQVHRRGDAVVIAVFLLVVVAFSVVWPMHTPRVVVAALLLLVPVIATLALLLLRAPRPMDAAAQVTVVPFMVLAVLMVARIVGELQDGWRVDPPPVLSALTQLQSAAVLLMPLWATLGFALMVNARLNAALERLANRDPLTDLPNRRAFDVATSAALRDRREGIAVLAIDADHFKRINDAVGHPGGDLALRHISDRLGAALGDRGVLARMGGEEFSVLSVGTDRAEARALAERLRLAVATSPVAIDTATLALSVSIGVGFVLPGDGGIDAAQRRADRALYAAKAAGRDRVAMAD